MAEVSRSPKMEFVPASVQVVHDGIIQAAITQEPESIEKAIQSFDWISNKESYTDFSQSSFSQQAIPASAFVAAPVEYFSGGSVPAGEIVSSDQLAAVFRNPNFRTQQG